MMHTLPDYQGFMAPLLIFCNDEQPHSLKELVTALSLQMELSQEQQEELTPRGTKTKVQDRTHWAAYYLKRALCLKTPSRGVYQITQRGKQLISSSPIINTRILEQFPEFCEFLYASRKSNAQSIPIIEPSIESNVLTPEEQLSSAHQELQTALSETLLDTIKQSVSPRNFEFLVTDLLTSMGYGGGKERSFMEITRYSNDEGIDGILKEDALGLDLVCVQAKRYIDKSIGRPEVQAFSGSLDGKRAKKGVFITTSKFTSEAQKFVENIEKRIVLIDGETLARYMIEFGVGVTPDKQYTVYKIDSDYFEQL